MALEGLQPHKSQHSRGMRMAALVGLGALAIMFLVSRRGTSTAAGGASQQDIANAAAAAAQQQQANDATLGTPSTFADNGASAAGLADSVTQALGGVTDALNNQSNAFQQAVGSIPSTSTTDSTDAGTAAVSALGGALAAAISALGTGTKAHTGGKQNTAGKTNPYDKGATAAPSGATKPPPKSGYTIKGVGGGHWEYVPIPKTTTVKDHGSSSKSAGGTKKSGGSKRRH